MNAQKKTLIADLTAAIEATPSLAGDQPKKVRKAVGKTAKKLARKWLKVAKKPDRLYNKPSDEADTSHL